MVQNWALPFLQVRVTGSITAGRCIYRIEKDHTSVGHSSCETSARSFMISFPSSADDETECYLSFLTNLKIGMLKAQLLWILLRTLIAGIYALSQKTGQQNNMHGICFFLINWHDRVEKSNSQPFHIFLNIVLKDGPGNKSLAANWILFVT